MMRGKAFAVASILIVGSVATMGVERFSFAGLSLATTLVDLKKKYARSTFVDQLMHVSDEDAHDGLGTVALGLIGGRQTLTLTFERQRRGARPSYPACAQMLSALERRYGRPAKTIDAAEEQARNRRFEWTSATESLTLSCFRMPRQPLYAERITISAIP